MPRKKHRGIWPIDLPKIQTHTITSILDAAKTDPEYQLEHKRNAGLLQEAELWWIAKPMAILASHAKETLPDTQTLADNRPSLAGSFVSPWWLGGQAGVYILKGPQAERGNPLGRK